MIFSPGNFCSCDLRCFLRLGLEVFAGFLAEADLGKIEAKSSKNSYFQVRISLN